MFTLDALHRYLTSDKLWLSIITIIIGFVVWFIIKRGLIRQMRKLDLYKSYQKNTHVFLTIIKLCWCIFIFLVLMRINGIELRTLTAGLGITGIVVGFALQDLLKDWIMGVSIIIDDYYGVGDVVDVDGVIGEVVKLSFKTTKIRDSAYGNIVSFNNRTIEKVYKLSNSVDICVPIPYSMDVEDADSLLKLVMARMEKCESLSNVRRAGVQEFAKDAIMELVCADCSNPDRRNQAMRDMRTAVRIVFDEQGIEIPHIRSIF